MRDPIQRDPAGWWPNPRDDRGEDPGIPRPPDAVETTGPADSECWVCATQLDGLPCLRLSSGEHVCPDCAS